MSELSVGMQIAVPSAECFFAYGTGDMPQSEGQDRERDVMWDEIEEIRELPEERVWDIEVEGTHNFVAGHLFDKKTGNKLTEEEEKAWIEAQGDVLNVGQCRYGGVYAHNTYLDGSVGIGTATPNAKLSIFDQTSDLRDAFTVATSTDSSVFRVDTAGDAYAQGAFNSGGADYAEHFYTDSSDLQPGEVVCVSLENENAVARCMRPRDGNVMGIVSTNPAIIGNTGNIEQSRSVVVGMLGQVPAKVSNENGEIRPGDSLTPASVAGYAMRADGGDPTVGVALERLSGATGTVRVLISRRNKSLTVEQVEEAVVDRIAAMEIEDEVALLVSDAVSGYDFDPVVSGIIGTELVALEQDFNLRLSDEISELRALIASQELNLIEELADLVAINTNLTVSGELEARDGLFVPLDTRHAELVSASSSSTPAAFRVASDGTVTAFSDFIISDGVNATSVRDTLALLTADSITKTNLTVTQDLYAGNSFEVMGAQVAGASVSRPVFRVAADGTITVREDLVLSGYTAWRDIPGIVSVFAYDTAADIDGGEWITGNRSASWYNEPIDAPSSALGGEACDLNLNDRCGSRSFPSQAILAADSDTLYIFNAQDGSLWKRLEAVPSPPAKEGLGEVMLDAADGDITAIHAKDGVVYAAQKGVVSIMDFKRDSIGQVSTPFLQNDSITSLHTQRINNKTYLAIAGDAGIDVVNMDDETAAHYAGAASSAALAESGDLYATATSTLSVFSRVHLQDELAPTTAYTATSTDPLVGLQVSADGSAAYTASGSLVLAVAGSEAVSFDIGEAVVGLHVDESARVIYVATATSVRALAMGDGTVLATYESGEDSMGADWSAVGASHVASLTRFGSAREGELLSDTLVIATPQGLLALSADNSLRALQASGGRAGSPENAGRLRITDEALFSGRISVADGQNRPVFSIDETTGNAFIREDIMFGKQAALRAVAGARDAFVYDTAQDADGGQWRQGTALTQGNVGSGMFPQKAALIAGEGGVYVFDANTNELALVIDAVAAPSFIRAVNGTLAIADQNGITLVDLAGVQDSRNFPIASAINGLAFAAIRGTLYAGLATDTGAIRINTRTHAIDTYATDSPVFAVALSVYGDLYYATGNEAYAGEEILGVNELLGDVPAESEGGSIAGMALSGSTLYIAHDAGIIALDLATNAVSLLDGLGIPESVSVMDTGELLIAGTYQGKAAVIKATTAGDILDVWTADEERLDDAGLAYDAQTIVGASALSGSIAIVGQDASGNAFAWLESEGFSLRDRLGASKTVLTVTDRVQTPAIVSVASLSFTASSTISFYTASSTPALVVRENGDVSVSGNILTSGKVGIGTTTPEFMLDVAGDARASSITSETISASAGAVLGSTTASELRILDGYLQIKTVAETPPAADCDAPEEYGRMAFDAAAETLYLCGQSGFKAFSAATEAAPAP